ncbi:hypothetical protein D3C87_1493560 [compost metagenome]
MLEKHAQPGVERHTLLVRRLLVIGAQDFDRAGAVREKAQHGAHQHRLAGTGCSNEAENFAAIDIEVEIVEHDLVAEADGQIPHGKYDPPVVLCCPLHGLLLV